VTPALSVLPGSFCPAGRYSQQSIEAAEAGSGRNQRQKTDQTPPAAGKNTYSYNNNTYNYPQRPVKIAYVAFHTIFLPIYIYSVIYFQKNASSVLKHLLSRVVPNIDKKDLYSLLSFWRLLLLHSHYWTYI
jgi:hypothetical protein